MADWHEAKVVANTRAADGLFHLTLDVEGTPLAAAHTAAGQYVKLSLEGQGEGTFAIASPPGGARFEFLIKEGPGLPGALKEAKAGSGVRVTAPTGKGFPLERARGRDVLLFATGSGISAIRSAIEVIRRERKAFGRVILFFGVRTPAAFAYDGEISEWERSGIDVRRTVSRPGNSGWQGLTGYVQAHLGEVDVSNALAFLVGQRGMVSEVTEALARRGLTRENVFLNF